MKTVLSTIFFSLISVLAVLQSPPSKSSMQALEDNRVKFSLFAPESQDAPPQNATLAARVHGARPYNSRLLKSAAVREQVYVKELIPHIDSYYRVKPGRENRAMAGLSPDGFQTLMIGLNHSELFFSYGFFCAAIMGNTLSDPKTAFDDAFADGASSNSKTKLMWFGAITAEPQFQDMATDAIKMLTGPGIKQHFMNNQILGMQG